MKIRNVSLATAEIKLVIYIILFQVMKNVVSKFRLS